MISVLVAVDFCEHSPLTLELGHALARGAKGRLTALHVVRLPGIPPEETPDEKIEWTRMRSYAVSSALETLEKLLVRVGLSERADRSVIVSDDTANGILKEAQRVGADLIVVGSHDRPFLSRLVIGGVGRRLQKRAHCPVIVVRSGVTDDVAGAHRHRAPRRAVMKAEVLE